MLRSSQALVTLLSRYRPLPDDTSERVLVRATSVAEAMQAVLLAVLSTTAAPCTVVDTARDSLTSRNDPHGEGYLLKLSADEPPSWDAGSLEYRTNVTGRRPFA
jgi:hypothetical protein